MHLYFFLIQDGEDACKEDDSGMFSVSVYSSVHVLQTDNKNDKDGGDGDDPPERTNQTATSVQPPTETQSRHYGRQDSNVPMGEADECSSPVAKAKFVIGVKLITKIPQLKEPVNSTYLPEVSKVEQKNSCLLESNLTDLVLVSML